MIEAEDTYRIVLPYACFSIDVLADRGTIIDAAPIARWAIGKSFTSFVGWVKHKGGSVKLLGRGIGG